MTPRALAGSASESTTVASIHLSALVVLAAMRVAVRVGVEVNVGQTDGGNGVVVSQHGGIRSFVDAVMDRPKSLSVHAPSFVSSLTQFDMLPHVHCS